MRGPDDMCDTYVQNNQQSLNVGDERSLNKSVDFSEYMWMVEEGLDDFDQKCEEEFWQEYWMQEAFEEMVEEEEILSTQYYILPEDDCVVTDGIPIEGVRPLIQQYYPHITGLETDLTNLNFNVSTNTGDLTSAADDENVNSHDVIQLSTTPLNPDAPEFIPRNMQQPEPCESGDR